MLIQSVANSRQNRISIIYEGKNITTSIEKSLLSCIYKEAVGDIDSLEITVEDLKGNWIGPWNPLKGDEIKLEYINKNLIKTGDIDRVNNIGTFYLDTIEFSGPPDTVSIKALSTPIDSKLMDMTKIKVWENINLKKIVEEMAKNARLELFYYVNTDREYKRIEQDTSDYDTLKKICDENGLVSKVYKDKLVIYEESKMESRDPVISLDKKKLTSYHFQTTDTKAYSECEISYFDHKLNKKIEQKVVLKERNGYKGNPKRVLLIQEDKSPPGNTAAQKKEYLKTIAKKALKQKNKRITTANISLYAPEIWLSCGEIINFSGVGNFSGNYLITGLDIDLKNYRVDLDLRRVNNDDIIAEEVLENEV